MSVFGVILVRMRENSDQNNSEHGHFLRSVGFSVCSLSSLTNNLAKVLYKGKSKDYKSSLEYVSVNDGLLTFKSVNCNKPYEKNLK